MQGINSGFCRKCLGFPGFIWQGVVRFAGVSTPPCMPNYALGPSSPACTVGVQQKKVEKPSIYIYPTPSQGVINIKYDMPGEMEFFDFTGRIVKRFVLAGPQTQIQVTISDFSPGVYFYKYTKKGLQIRSSNITVTK